MLWADAVLADTGETLTGARRPTVDAPERVAVRQLIREARKFLREIDG